MPLSSEEIFYADNKSVMSLETLSAARATSAGDRISKLLKQAGTTVASDFERNEMFPEPKQGDVVWRSDLAVEQRYFELYSSVNLQGRTPAGWYAVKNSFVPIVYNAGFAGVNEINLPNIFSLAFNNYLILGQVDLNAAGNLISRVSINGVPEIAASYQRTRISGSNNVTTSSVATTTNFFLSDHATSLSNRHCFQATVYNPMQNLFTKQTVDFGSVTQTTNSSVGAASGTLLNTNSYDGFWFGATASRLMTGNVSVYGYN
jgi:hypothetical protein